MSDECFKEISRSIIHQGVSAPPVFQDPTEDKILAEEIYSHSVKSRSFFSSFDGDTKGPHLGVSDIASIQEKVILETNVQERMRSEKDLEQKLNNGYFVFPENFQIFQNIDVVDVMTSSWSDGCIFDGAADSRNTIRGTGGQQGAICRGLTMLGIVDHFDPHKRNYGTAEFGEGKSLLFKPLEVCGRSIVMQFGCGPNFWDYEGKEDTGMNKLRLLQLNIERTSSVADHFLQLKKKKGNSTTHIRTFFSGNIFAGKADRSKIFLTNLFSGIHEAKQNPKRRVVMLTHEDTEVLKQVGLGELPKTLESVRNFVTHHQ